MDEHIKEDYTRILTGIRAKFELFAKLSGEALNSLESAEQCRDMNRLIAQFDQFGADIWNDMLRLMDQADNIEENEDCLLRSLSATVFIGKEYLCVKMPLLSTGNRRNRQRLYPAVLERKLCEHVNEIPDFKDKVILAVNVYSTQYNRLRIADPSNLDSKKAIDAITSFIGGDGASNTAVYISSCIVSDDIEEGCYILVIDEPSLRSRLVEALASVLSKNEVKVF